MIEQTLNNGVLTMRLAYGKASALDVTFLEGISAALSEASANDDVKALVLTGTGSIFGAGVDLKQILEGKAEYAHRFLPVLDATLEALFVFPKPMVSAINGHAIAGGCIVALAADYKLMAEGKGRIGVPELKVGVPFPASAFEIVRFSVPKSQVQTLMYGANTYLPDEALARGMVDELVAPEALLEAAQKMAEELAEIPAQTYNVTKRMLRGESVKRIQAHRETVADEVKQRWSSDATYDHIRGYLEKTLK